MPACQPCKEIGKEIVADRIVGAGKTPMCDHHYRAYAGLPPLISPARMGTPQTFTTVSQAPAAVERKETPVEKCECGKLKGHRGRCPGGARAPLRPANGKGVNYEAVLQDIHQKIEKLRAADAAIREMMGGQL